MEKSVVQNIVLGMLFVCAFVFATPVHAQEKQILSVTPPLFQLSVNPGDLWQSSVKVVNGNPYPITVYAEVVNFEAFGEEGQGRFVPIQHDNNATLGEWLTLKKGPYTIDPEQTEDISFFAEVPKNAAPGGHYAAILISTEEPKNTGEIAVKASQAVTSLLFARIEGDVLEEGTIREFRSVKSLLDTPSAEFSLRFENKGNVHLLPRGDIVITNMWGAERGKIPINYKTHYGNVLPKSIRDFTFLWKSDFEISDIGRYKAVATLGYGENGMKSTTATTYFWVVPIKWTLITLGVLTVFVWLVVLMVKAYIRRMLTLAGVNVSNERQQYNQQNTGATKKNTYQKVAAPIKDGVLDLRKRLDETKDSNDRIGAMVELFKTYKFFIASFVILCGIVATVALYISSATHGDQPYEVQITENGETTTLTNTEVGSLVK